MKAKSTSKAKNKTDGKKAKASAKGKKKIDNEKAEMERKEKERKEKEEQERLQKEKEEKEKKEKEEKERQLKILQSIRYSVNFIYRRDQYVINNEKYFTTFAQIKNKISKQLSLPVTDITILYKDKEFTDNTIKVYELFKQQGENYFTVKKKLNIDKFSQLPSIASNNYAYTVILNNIPSGKELTEKVEMFFNQLMLDKNYVIEPIGLNEFSVSFTHNDLAFDFKRYIFLLKKTVPQYQDVNIKLKPVEKTIKKKNLSLDLSSDSIGKKKKNMFKNSPFLSHGPYITYEQMRKKEEAESKKKWLNKNGFNNIVGKAELDY